MERPHSPLSTQLITMSLVAIAGTSQVCASKMVHHGHKKPLYLLINTINRIVQRVGIQQNTTQSGTTQPTRTTRHSIARHTAAQYAKEQCDTMQHYTSQLNTTWHGTTLQRAAWHNMT